MRVGEKICKRGLLKCNKKRNGKDTYIYQRRGTNIQSYTKICSTLMNHVYTNQNQIEV